MEPNPSNEIVAFEPDQQAGVDLAYKFKKGNTAESPLVFLVHGRAGNFDVMWTFARAVPKNAAIIAPQAPLLDGHAADFPNGMSWWAPLPKRDIKPDAVAAAQALLVFMKRVIALHGLNPSVKLAAGFSQGAAIISTAMQLEPRFFDGIAMLSGFVIELGDSKDEQLPPVFMAHGTKDEVVTIDKFERGKAFLEVRSRDFSSIVEDVGHKVGSKSVRELSDWFSSFNI